MATNPTDKNRSDDGVPKVNPEIRSSIDRSYDPNLEGSSPLETTSVKVDQERNLWPIIWAVTTIVMVLLTIYLLWG